MKNKWQIIQIDKGLQVISAGIAIQTVTIKYLFCKSVIWHQVYSKADEFNIYAWCFEVCTQYIPLFAKTEVNLWTPQKEIE